jgi:YesN/AraC family two-component response regulator
MVTIHKNEDSMTVTRGVYLQQYQKWGWELSESVSTQEPAASQEIEPNYSDMTVAQLREQAAAAGYENAEGFKKAELIALLTDE